MFTKLCIGLAELYEQTLGKLNGWGAIICLAVIVVLLYTNHWLYLLVFLALLACEVIGEIISEKKGEG